MYTCRRHTIFNLIVMLFPIIISAQSIVLENTNVERLLELAIQFQERSALNKARAIAKAQQEGWSLREELGNAKVMELMGLDTQGKPVYYITDNFNAAITVSTNWLWPGETSGLDLDGSGMIAGEWDEGGVLSTHQELTGRINQVDSPSSNSDHSTHVAGTILASGVQANAHGMAPAASLNAYDWNDDDSEMASAASSGLLISNHSYGYGVGWYYYGLLWAGDETISAVEDYKFGCYTNDQSKAWDDIAYNAPYYLIMKSAGNDRGEGSNSQGHEVDGGANGHDCIGPQGVAKNILTVGAIHDITSGWTQVSDVQMTDFSSWGPTDDGRIKPDLVANGMNLYSCISSSNTSYDTYPGTSMATPNATGSLLLLQELYQFYSGGNPMRAATLKGLAIHTTDEAGAASGPDYIFGWGLLNTLRAASVIDSVWNDQKEHVINELSLAQDESYSMQVTSDGTTPLWATICWTDPSGTPVSPAELDPSDIMLVNDLDLRITGNSTTHYPWKFDSANPNTPSSSATTGDNILDNVEQVYVASPASAIYTITVSHKGTLTSGPQHFSLIMSGAHYSDASLPVELTSFASEAGNGMARLNWKTESELDNLGFNVLRSEQEKCLYKMVASYKTEHTLQGLGSSSIGKEYAHNDFDLENGTTYWYKIQDVCIDGRRTDHGPVPAIPQAFYTMSKELFFAPQDFRLEQNFPNPFNPSTKINYHIGLTDAGAMAVKLVVFNTLGQPVKTLLDKKQEPGRYSISFSGTNLASGIYWYTISAGAFRQTEKMLLIK